MYYIMHNDTGKLLVIGASLENIQDNMYGYYTTIFCSSSLDAAEEARQNICATPKDWSVIVLRALELEQIAKHGGFEPAANATMHRNNVNVLSYKGKLLRDNYGNLLQFGSDKYADKFRRLLASKTDKKLRDLKVLEV